MLTNRMESEQKSSGPPPLSGEAEHQCMDMPDSPLYSPIQNILHSFIGERLQAARNAIIDSKICSEWLFLLAMPTLSLILQCGLFLFGKICSPFPIWFSSFVFSLLALFIHWKCLVKFWGLIFLALFLSAFTFSYMDFDAEVYHFPMQFLLREGWNPVFDSSLEKFAKIPGASSLWVYHTLFLPKTVALCGALVAEASGLWIADSFLGYVLLFVMFRTAFAFAQNQWKCTWKGALLFALTISLNSKLTVLVDGRIGFHTYSALMIALLSLVLYVRQHEIHDYILAIIATVICSTTKTTGLVNAVFLWGLFLIYSWKHKETYGGILAVTLLVAWIGMSPLITAWIQYGSPFYPTMTFDPAIETVDITSDFKANADGEQMGYLARFVYAWISPALATKACALYYHKDDFHPVFLVTGGVGGLKGLNLLLCGSIVLLMLAKKDFVTFICLFFLVTMVLFPLKYIGYARYFPQAWAIIPMGFFQFVFYPPSWLAKRKPLQKLSKYSLCLLLCILCCFSAICFVSFFGRSLILEGQRQNLLADLRKNNVIVDLPQNSKRKYTLSKKTPLRRREIRIQRTGHGHGSF